MTLPKVTINIESGGLGRIPSLADGTAALLLTGKKDKSGSSSDKLYTSSHVVYSLAEAKKLLSADEQAENAYSQIENFYQTAGEGAELWLRLIPSDETFANVCKADGPAEQLLLKAKGAVRLLGLSHIELTGNKPSAAKDGIEGNITDGITQAQALAKRTASTHQPIHVIVAGHYVKTLADLKDYKEATNDRVSVLISGTATGSRYAALGLVLGTLARLPVQRSLARVKNGALPVSVATFTDGKSIEDYSAGLFSTLHTKRYLFFRNYIGLSGYYIADDLSLVAPTSDFATIANRRVIDKALRLAYTTYIEELAEEIILEDGKLSDANVKYLEGKLENVLNETMTNAGEVSAVSVFIDPTQNVLSTEKLNVELRLTPVGYTKEIIVSLGFTNPQNA